MQSPSTARVTHPLIASDRIEGTMVCRLDGAELGTIERLMINKISGQVAYAIVKAANASAARKRRFPLRWDAGAPMPHLLVNDYRALLAFSLEPAGPRLGRELHHGQVSP